MDGLLNNPLHKDLVNFPCGYCATNYGRKEFLCRGCNNLSYCTLECKKKDGNRHKCIKEESIKMGMEKYNKLKTKLGEELDSRHYDILFANVDRFTSKYVLCVKFFSDNTSKIKFIHHKDGFEETDRKGIKGVSVSYYAVFLDAWLKGFIHLDLITKMMILSVDGQSDNINDVKRLTDAFGEFS